MYCPNCGEKISKDAKFCKKCGKPIELSTPHDTEITEVTSKQFAGFWIRLLAYIIDYVIIFISMCILAFILGVIFSEEVNQISSEDLETLGTILGIILFYLYFWVATSVYQTTIGKRILKLKVISSNDTKISWGKAFLREIIGKILSSFVFGIGFLIIGFSKEKQGLHDIIAKTYVIYEKR
jgi:uncharacterized RDD family membrane protein YckC